MACGSYVLNWQVKMLPYHTAATQWKKGWHSERRQSVRRRSCKSEGITLQEATTVIRDWQIRLDVQAAISRVKVEGEGADDEDMKLVLAYLLCLLTYRSWQTPGCD